MRSEIMWKNNANIPIESKIEQIHACVVSIHGDPVVKLVSITLVKRLSRVLSRILWILMIMITIISKIERAVHDE